MLHRFLLFVISVAMIFFSGCDDNNTQTLETTILDSEDYGTLILNLSMLQDKIIEPDIIMEPSTYTITGNGPNGEIYTVTTDQQSIEISGIIFGDWTFSVGAENADGILIAEGDGSITIHSGETSTLEIIVSPLEGYGSLNLSVKWDDKLVENPIIDAKLNPVTGSPIDLSFDINGGEATYSNSALSTGYYTLTLVLYDNGIEVGDCCGGLAEVVRIVKDQTTNGTIDLDVNPNYGGIQINITLEMNDPIDMILNGEEDYLTLGGSMNVEASTPSETGTVLFVWYLNGIAKSTSNPITIGSDLSVGIYRLDVTAFTADGKRGGSISHTFSVIE